MSHDQAQRFIVLATFVTMGSTIGNTLKPPKGQKQRLKPHRVIAGAFFAMMFTAILAEADADLGVGLATLVAGGAFFKYGLPVLDEQFGEKTRKKVK
jgi:hypothetical protein